MLNLPPSVRLFVARGATDMRKSFDTLAALVTEVVDEDGNECDLATIASDGRTFSSNE